MTGSPERFGCLFILVAPAGAGKNALMNRVKTRVDGLRQLPTATTRGIREGEVAGREHLYVTLPEFQQMIEQEALLEWQEVHGRYYGVPRATVEDAMAAGEDLIADIEYLGATYIRSLYPENVILIFIQPPSVHALIERMRVRGDSEAEIARRLMRVPTELASATQCDYLILNEDIDKAEEILYSIVIAERSHREILKLRALNAAPQSPFTCAASAIVVSDGDVLYHESGEQFPSALVREEELSHEAALRAVREQLHIEAAADHLVLAQDAKGAVVPPVTINLVHQGDTDQVTMVYVYNLPERITPPAGWRWARHDQVTLPPQVVNVLAKLPT